MTRQPLIWLTRPREDSEPLAAELARHGIASLVAPVMRIAPHPLAGIPQLPDAVLITSRHAAHALAHLPAEWRHLTVYCVGDATAHAASEHGYTHIHPGSGNVHALMPRIAQDLGANTTLHYLSGEQISVDVAHLLASHSIRVIRSVVYDASAEHTLNTEVERALGKNYVTGICFFSARSARITGDLIAARNLQHAAKTIEAFCLSLQVAEAAAQVPWAALHACHLPLRQSMVELMVSHRDKTL